MAYKAEPDYGFDQAMYLLDALLGLDPDPEQCMSIKEHIITLMDIFDKTPNYAELVEFIRNY